MEWPGEQEGAKWVQAARQSLKDSRREKEVIAGRAELEKGRLSPGEAAATVAEFPQGKAIPLGMVEPAKVLPKPINWLKKQQPVLDPYPHYTVSRGTCV